MMNKKRITIILIAMLASVAASGTGALTPINCLAKASFSVPPAQGKIAAFVYYVRSERARLKGGRSWRLFESRIESEKSLAHNLAKVTYVSALRRRVCPYWSAATLMQESHYDWASTPQIGYAQFTRGTGASMRRKYGYNIYDRDENVMAGVSYLAENYYTGRSRAAAASRSGSRDIGMMRKASAIYNAGTARSGVGQAYAASVLRWRGVIMNGSKAHWGRYRKRF